MGCSGSGPAPAFHDKYDIGGDKIGGGSFADVWPAFSKTMPTQEFAVKIIADRSSSDFSSRASSGSSTSRRSFDLKEVASNEISAMRRIGGHDNCVKLHESFCEGGFYYLILDKCHATIMDQRKEIRCWTEWAQASMIKGVLLGLVHLHRSRVMHRDINPKNILLTTEGTPKLCDFGFATSFTGILKQRVGTLPYMSPEMLGDYGYAHETDVWSLGVSLYLLVYGVLPYKGAQGTVRALLDEILVGKSPPQFKPEGECSEPPSALMTGFVQQLLDTSRFTRCTSSKALESPIFFEPPPEVGITLI